MLERRVVITGAGVVSPLGSDLKTFQTNLKLGKSGITLIKELQERGFKSQIGGKVQGFNEGDFLSKTEQLKTEPYAKYAIGAADMALSDSGLNLKTENFWKIGAIIGTGVGGLQTLEKGVLNLNEKGPGATRPFTLLKYIPNMAPGFIAMKFGLKGPNNSVSSGCATSGHSIAEACRIIYLNEADVMLAGGAEASICDIGVDAFCGMHALSTRNKEPEKASRPFDRDRDGFVMSDGAAVFVIEELERAKKRGAKIYCEIAGYGSTCDAFSMTSPLENGEAAAYAIRLALNKAKLNPENIKYIHAHGTSTLLGDIAETRAIKSVFREHAKKIWVILKNQARIVAHNQKSKKS